MAAPDWTKMAYDKKIRLLRAEYAEQKEKYDTHHLEYITANGDDGSEYVQHNLKMSLCFAYAIEALDELQLRVGTKKDIMNET